MTALSEGDAKQSFRKGNHPIPPHDASSPTLNQIDGMGVVRRSWLRALGIYTLQDLAVTSADLLEAQFQAQGYIVSRSDLEAWIEQAIELTSVQPSMTPVEPTPLLNEDLEDWAALEAERDEFLQGGCLICGTGMLIEMDEELEEEPSSTSSDTIPWRSLASFEVKFQTRQEGGCFEEQTVIYYGEGDRQVTWVGFAEQELDNWMAEQLQLVSALRP